jgi:hypothetical protein
MITANSSRTYRPCSRFARSCRPSPDSIGQDLGIAGVDHPEQYAVAAGSAFKPDGLPGSARTVMIHDRYSRLCHERPCAVLACTEHSRL